MRDVGTTGNAVSANPSAADTARRTHYLMRNHANTANSEESAVN